MNNIPQDYYVTRELRSKLKGHNSLVVWFTGLSGSGKSTIASYVEKELYLMGIQTYTLDGDNIRRGLNKNLGFTGEDRTENLRRIAEVAKLFLDSGTVVLSAFITPMESQREMIKRIVGEEKFVEVFVKTTLEECERRDVKGLYKKAREGEIKDFTGISSPFEIPENSDIILNTEEEDLKELVQKILSHILPKINF